MDKIKLYDDISNCCGCGACLNICPKDAITMEKDEYGSLYPKINKEKCIECGACMKVCAYQSNTALLNTKQTFVAVSKDENLLKKSTSGGIFASFAKEVLNDNGVVFGCSMEYKNNRLSPEHIMVDNINDLQKLQGSKYVQSNIGNTYKQVKENLDKGKVVLFSGTPCQVDGLNGFLKNKTYENLLTMDLICHGVPSSVVFKDYIRLLEKKNAIKITNFNFRDKNNGWDLKGSFEYISKNNIKIKKILPLQLSSYYKLFFDSVIYRENCYSCKYASENRPSDITIGDFWGIQKEHPELLVNNGGKISPEKGVSCILLNSEKGVRFIEKYGHNITLHKSEFEKVQKHNHQLKKPSLKHANRQIVLDIYKNEGYKAVDKCYYKNLGLKKYAYILWNKIPLSIRQKIKN